MRFKYKLKGISSLRNQKWFGGAKCTIKKSMDHNLIAENITVEQVFICM